MKMEYAYVADTLWVENKLWSTTCNDSSRLYARLQGVWQRTNQTLDYVKGQPIWQQRPSSNMSLEITSKPRAPPPHLSLRRLYLYLDNIM